MDVIGGREREIIVNLDPEKLAAHNLTIFQVAALLKAQNTTIPGGFVTSENREYSVKVSGEYCSLDEIRETQIPVFKQYGTVSENYKVRIKDIATVEDGYKSYMNSHDIRVNRFNLDHKNSDANVVNCNMVIAKVEEINLCFRRIFN